MIVDCIGNNWAVDPRKCGITSSMRVTAGGDSSSVLLHLQRVDDGKVIRLNLTKPQASALIMELQAACHTTTYDPHGLLRRTNG